MLEARRLLSFSPAVSYLVDTSPHAQAASLQGLGDLPGGLFASAASGVSGDGSTVVGSSFSASGREAFRWTSGGGMVGLGDLPGGSFESFGSDVSGDGSVVVGGSNSASGIQAFRWTSGGGMAGLGDLPGGSFFSLAYDVSGDGSVVVGDSSSASGIDAEAFRWTSGGGMAGLGQFPGGEGYSEARGVSGDGSVVVGYGVSASGGEAFRWTSGSGMTGLGDLPGDWFYSTAYGVSADGSVVVGQGRSASGREAFRWTSAGGMVGLGDLPGEPFSSFARGVSGDGSVVVGTGNYVGDAVGDAFRWTSSGGMERLWDLLLAQGVDPAAGGWTSLGGAAAVSLDGNTIVGYGTHNGNLEAFVAVVPVIPATKTYVGPNGGNWSTASNWSPSGVPTAADSVLINGKAVNLSASATVAGLTLTGGTALTVVSNGSRVLRVGGGLSIATGCSLNLADNDLILDYSGVSPVGIWTGSAYDGVTGMVKSGRILSSAASGTLTTLAVAEARDARDITGSQTALFAGQTVDSTSVLVKFTWGGDANLDGKINIDDYGQIDFYVGSSGSVFGYFNGDFNLDGKINIDDYGIIDFNVAAQTQLL